MSTVPFVGIIDQPIAGGHISVGAMPRSYQVTPEILGRRRATQPPTVRPMADIRLKGQPAAEPRTYRSCRTPPPDTTTLSLRDPGLGPISEGYVNVGRIF
jgi:hypothetical protein